MEQKNTFKVEFNSSIVVEKLTLEQALQFALNLHQSSNVQHNVYVTEEGDTTSILVLHTN